jgi:sulfatase maturation enzyme AslB (radical SAM superfamily)
VKPHEKNACAGFYDDWLEVHLLPECNGKCEWCVEKTGFHPTEKAEWEEIVQVALDSRRKNIILLGGEPTLHKNIGDIINRLHHFGRNVYMTTNGSQLSHQGVEVRFKNLTGVNISIHHYDLLLNKAITGIKLDFHVLYGAVRHFQAHGCSVRLNCNVIDDMIDNIDEIIHYLVFAEYLGVNSIRFAELKDKDDKFISLAKIFAKAHGLNEDPYKLGCHQETYLRGMKISFRQLCGLHCKQRPIPNKLDQTIKEVLYYDAKMYPGWVIPRKDLMSKAFENKLEALEKKKKLTKLEVAELKAEFYKAVVEATKDTSQSKPVVYESGGGCRY